VLVATDVDLPLGTVDLDDRQRRSGSWELAPGGGEKKLAPMLQVTVLVARTIIHHGWHWIFLEELAQRKLSPE